MNCGDVRPRIPELELGRLAPELRASVEAHLRHCAACRLSAEEVSSGIASLRALAAAEALLPVPAVDATAFASPPVRKRSVAPRALAAAALLLLAAAAGAWGADLRASAREALLRGELRDTLRAVAATIADSERRRTADLEALARWVARSRSDDSAVLAGAIEATRADLALTQNAILRVADHVPVLPIPR